MDPQAIDDKQGCGIRSTGDCMIVGYNTSGNSTQNATEQTSSYIYDYYYYDDEGPFEDAVGIMNKILLPIVIFGGVISNTMSFLVFVSTHLRMHSSTVYLAFLNFVDSLFLLFLLPTWLGWVGVFVIHKVGWCRLIVYGTNITSFLSVWGVVSFTIERYIVVYHPLQRNLLCTRGKALMTVVSLTLVAVTLYSYTLVATRVVYQEFYGNVCVNLSKYASVVRIISTLDTVITLILPAVAIVLFNFAIAIKIWDFLPGKVSRLARIRSPEGRWSGIRLRTRRNRESTTSPATKSSSESDETKTRTSPVMPKRMAPRCTELREHMSRSSSDARRNIQIRTTRSLLIVSSVFVLLNLPSHSLRVHLAMNYYLDSKTPQTDNLQRWQQILQLISYLNYSANFFLYCACSRTFRAAFMRMCRRWRQSLKYVIP